MVCKYYLLLIMFGDLLCDFLKLFHCSVFLEELLL